MAQYYVICTRDNGENKLYYYTGRESFYGGSYLGNVLKAKRFDSMKEVMEEVVKHEDVFYLGFNVILIADCTFKAIEENKELYYKFHDPNYAIR